MEKPVNVNKKIDIMKEDKQAFGLLVGKVSTPSEALQYPLTSVPLALADPDRSLRSQNSKSTFRNEIIKMAEAVRSNINDLGTVDWFVDGMLAVNSLKPQPTWKDFADSLLSYCAPKCTLNVRRLSIIFDSYSKSTIKQMTQMKRGYSGNRVFITSLKQKMPQGKLFDLFLNNPDNKIELIEAIVRRLSCDSIRAKLSYELVVSQENETFLIASAGVTE